MPRQLNARLLHHKMEKLREKGKDGEYVSDGTVRGLKYEKQGDGIYARLRVMNKATGKLVYRYNSHSACARSLPSCEGPGARTMEELVKLTVSDGQTRTLSCYTQADASRGVGWAAGPLPGKGLVYAAMMEGDRAFPGRMMADRLARAFRSVGL